MVGVKRKNKGKKQWKKRSFRGLFLPFLLIFGMIGIWLAVWTACAEAGAHFTPEYEPVDLSFCMSGEKLTEEDYKILFCQTGLRKTAVDTLRVEGSLEDLCFLQERFFQEVEICCERNTIVTRQELLKSDAGFPEASLCFPILENGDILITFNCHCFGWRSGHAGIVVDAEEGLVLEATSLGSVSDVMCLSHWEEYPAVAVLRLKNATLEERAEIAAYAEENLQNVPYRLSAGLLPVSSGTQCAHLVWSAYRQFGYDLDGDGGRLVTPCDLYESPLLELIQIYGMNPEKLG